MPTISQVDIPKYHCSEKHLIPEGYWSEGYTLICDMLLSRTVIDPKDRFSEKYLKKREVFFFFFIPNGNFSEMFLIRKFVSPKI